MAGDGAAASAASEWPAVLLAAATREQACALIAHAIHHMLFAKGQVNQPITMLRKRKSMQQQQQQREDDVDGLAEGGREARPRRPSQKQAHGSRRRQRNEKKVAEVSSCPQGMHDKGFVVVSRATNASRCFRFLP